MSSFGVFMRRAAAVIALALTGVSGIASGPAAASDADRSAAVLLMYHRFGVSQTPSTNITLDQFEAHIRHLAEGGYKVLPLEEIVAALRSGAPLPDRAVAITIDDAHVSAYREAWPRLRDAGLPFTLFVATDAVDRGYAGVMTWDQIRELKAAGVTIGLHSAAHAHMTELPLDKAREDLERGKQRLEAELGEAPAFFAYPFGEIGADLKKLVASLGLEAAFGQQSGVAYSGADRFALPRFALNEHYGAMDRFRLVADALPLPVRDVTPADWRLTADANPPAFGFTLDDAGLNTADLNCYPSGGVDATTERLGPRRMELRFDGAFAKGRARINCTMPAGHGRWRWFGVQFYIP